MRPSAYLQGGGDPLECHRRLQVIGQKNGPASECRNLWVLRGATELKRTNRINLPGMASIRQRQGTGREGGLLRMWSLISAMQTAAVPLSVSEN